MTDLLIVTAADLALLRQLGRHPALERELERAVVVSSEAMPPDVVTMNSAVIYTDETHGLRRFVKIVYPQEAAADDGRISVLSPVGTALLGLSAGQADRVGVPGRQSQAASGRGRALAARAQAALTLEETLDAPGITVGATRAPPRPHDPCSIEDGLR